MRTNTDPTFKVEVHERLVYFQVRGVWTLNADLQWLTRMSEVMNGMRGAPWYVLADMRGWILSEEIAKSSFKAKLAIDRQNEKAECWWVNKDHNLGHLNTFKNKLPVEVAVATELSEVHTWLQNQIGKIPKFIDDFALE